MTRPLDALAEALCRAERESHLRSVAPAVGGSRMKNTSRPPLPLELLDCRVDVDRVLREWCDLVVSKRAVTGPADMSSLGMVAWLRRHVDWLDDEDLGYDFDKEMAKFAGRLSGLLDGDGGRRRPLGPCQVDGCDGKLRPTTRRTDGVAVVCDTCGDKWDAGSLPRLGRLLQHPTTGRAPAPPVEPAASAPVRPRAVGYQQLAAALRQR